MPSLLGLKYLTLHLLATAIPSVLSSPLSPQPLPPRNLALSPGSGTHSGFFYTYWTDGGGAVSYANKNEGAYAVSWKNCSNFFGGKGWGPAESKTDRTISYSANKFDTSGNAYLSVYGMTRSSPSNKGGGLVEFYIMENYGTYDPTTAFDPKYSGKDGGVLKVEGEGEYRIGYTRSYYMTTMPGTSNSMVLRVYSVRKADQRRSAGTVDLKRHFEAWKSKLDVDVGEKFDFQIVAVEGYQSSGEAEVTVGEV